MRRTTAIIGLTLVALALVAACSRKKKSAKDEQLDRMKQTLCVHIFD